ncbi:MAG: hypothetical protein AMDU5_GPLC00010G0046 [Thermoplasmatales archaeon Gpl]|jgi:hypothetical protein|nr:MAG: hypothetical protein AMDU5_GPLC00010G0046 [Thermoplasmatales archaeon Gpl]
MGITFFVESYKTPVSACITWAQYNKVINDDNETFYERQPRAQIIEIPLDGRGKISIDDNKNIYLHYYINKLNSDSDRRSISLFVVNEIEPKNRKITEVENTLFQPQIRIKLGDGTKLSVEDHKLMDSSKDSELELLYKHRDFSARGHLCSVVLKEFDPQIFSKDDYKSYSKSVLESPAFNWIDGKSVANLTVEEVSKFSEPDLRTEFVPLYSVPSPAYELSDSNGKPFIFSAKKISQMWKPEDLKQYLAPMLDSFEKWVESNKQEISGRPENEKTIFSRISNDAEVSLQRMKKGFNLLLSDENARFAFCVANKAMELQYEWTKKSESDGLKWRSFQIAYFLLTIESIFNPNSDDRSVCDLLWVATGGGKTEAYLAIIAFTIVIRRLKGRERPDEGFGTSVITRYTLRLLAIQQFRRMLSLITSLEYLRVSKVDKGKFGWRPEGYFTSEGYSLGSSPFTIGLWVGSGVTPNNLEGNDYMIEGAISKLKKKPEQSGNIDASDPAQITNCPACQTILSIPAEGLGKGKHVFYIIIKADYSRLSTKVTHIKTDNNSVTLNSPEIFENENKDYSTLKLKLEIRKKITATETYSFLNKVINELRNYDKTLDIASSNLTRPGYFLRTYINTKGKTHEYNFEIFCPNPGCPLKIRWFAGTPAGMIHNKEIEKFLAMKDIPSAGKLKLKEIIDPFQSDGNIYYSDRIQIPAMTVDEQIYMFPPTVLLSTVDKFARPAFEPRSSSIFGNFDNYHTIYGYYREGIHGRGRGNHPSPSGSKTPLYVKVEKADPPDLILQDELHLIDGPLGGMVGIYETALDHLISEKNGFLPKYIASTATIRNAEDQVKAVFTRKVHMFPPFGKNSDDRFFIKESEIHALEDSPPGRLYLGIAAPGRGPLTPIYRIWARLLQTGWENRHDPDVDRFWTVTGYFNSIRELAGAVALYRQDIPQQLNIINRGNPRKISEDRKVELSSRINSTELPAILELLSRNFVPETSESVDALFTTSMFGTGIDISRLGLMIVNGQPKTTSSYIQSTGRIGRSKGGLVVTFLRASRPRDLSHYEYFTGFHRQLHKFVEPVSVYPFAPKILERALGPVLVFILRNTRLDNNIPWQLDENAGMMPQYRHSSSMVAHLKDIFELRSQNQPDIKKPSPNVTGRNVMEKIDTWEQENRISKKNSREVKYVEYFKAKNDVVLGDSIHRRSREVTTVYDDAPQSLRDIEETTSFET